MRVAMMTGALTKYMDQENAIKTIKTLGYDAVDITFKMSINDNDEMLEGDYINHAKKIRLVADELKIPIIQAHSPYPIHIDGDDDYNKRMIEKTIKILEICSVLGIKYCVIHPWNNWNAEKNKNNFYDKLIPYAQKYNVIITTENMWNWDTTNDRADYAACSTPEDFLKHCETMNSEFFKGCVDIGHANMFYYDSKITPRKMIETLGNKYCATLHIHDNDGKHDNHAPMRDGTVNWLDVIKALKNIHYQGDLISEFSTYRCNNLEEVLTACASDLNNLRQLRNKILE